MHAYSVGEPYAQGRTTWREGVEYSYRLGLHQFRLFFAQLTPAEAAAVGEEPASFALVVSNDLILFLFRFLPAFEWSDAPFS